MSEPILPTVLWVARDISRSPLFNGLLLRWSFGFELLGRENEAHYQRAVTDVEWQAMMPGLLALMEANAFVELAAGFEQAAPEVHPVIVEAFDVMEPLAEADLSGVS